MEICVTYPYINCDTYLLGSQSWDRELNTLRHRFAVCLGGLSTTDVLTGHALWMHM